MLNKKNSVGIFNDVLDEYVKIEDGLEIRESTDGGDLDKKWI